MIDPVNNPYPHQVGLMVAVPHTGRGLPPKFAWSMMNLHPPMNYQIRYATNMLPNGYVIPEAIDVWRNHFMETAIQQGCRYLLFIDEDVTFEHNALRNLIWTMEHHPEAAVVSGVYCCKTEPAWPLIFRGNGFGPFWDWKVGETFEVTGVGMGMALIRLDAVKEMEKPYFRTTHDFVNGDLNNVEAYTEDLFFLKQLTEKGWKVLVDSTVLCSHWDLASMTAFTLPLTSPPMMRWKFENDLPKVIVIGQDMEFRSAYPISRINIDWREAKAPDYRCHPSRLPFDGGIFDLAILEQSLPNFTFTEALDIIREARRMLKPGGVIRVAVPNVKALLEDDESLLAALYQQKSYWTAPELTRLMVEAKTDLEWAVSFSGKNLVCEGRVPVPVIMPTEVSPPEGVLDETIPIESPPSAEEISDETRNGLHLVDGSGSVSDSVGSG